MKKIYKIIPALLLFHQHFTSYSQSPDFMMQGWYWNFPGSVGTNSFMENLGLISGDFADAGFNYVWLPPLAKGTGGSFSVGFDVKDYYDIGEFGSARWGSYLDYILTIEQFNAAGINAVADVIYNHRDGGAWEKNISVEGWLENMNYDKIAAGDQPYPSNRFDVYSPLAEQVVTKLELIILNFIQPADTLTFSPSPLTLLCIQIKLRQIIQPGLLMK